MTVRCTADDGSFYDYVIIDPTRSVAVYSELSDEGYKKYEFAVTASANNIFDGDLIRFGSGCVLSFWFHIELVREAVAED